jgi:SAM domain (Sterile alpha motif)
MQQVADWLDKLGLGQYAQRFAENDADFALLAKLNDADLKEPGVTSLGHRKRLLEAISRTPSSSFDCRSWAMGYSPLRLQAHEDNAERAVREGLAAGF